MKIENPCNLEVPTGATPMTIADAILRECDREILEEVLYYIDCFLNKHGMSNNGGSEERESVKNYVDSISKPTGITFDEVVNNSFNFNSPQVKKMESTPSLMTDAVLIRDIIDVISGADPSNGTEKVFSGKEIIDLIKTLQPVQLEKETMFTDLGAHAINKNVHIYECAKCHHKMMISSSVIHCPECGAKVIEIL